MMTELKLPTKPIKGPGLTVAGVVILQFLLILIVQVFEYKFTKVGVLSGIAIAISFAGGLYLGRPGTSFSAVVNPPIAFLVATIISMITVGGSGLHVTKIGLDLVTSLAGVAPFLVVGAVIGWPIHIVRSRHERAASAAN